MSLVTSTPLMADSKSSPSYSKPSTPSYSRPTPSYPKSSPPSYSKPTIVEPVTPPSSSYSKPQLAQPSTPPSSSYSKPQLATPDTAPSSSYSKPQLAQPSRPATVAPPRSTADTAIARGQSKQAYTQYQAEQQKYKAPPIAAPQDTAAARQTPAWRQYGSQWNSADSYYSSRNAALQRAPASVRESFENPPSYVVAGRPSYGAYAAAFLGGALLANIMQPSYAQWAYSHSNDPGYQAWRTDMEKQAADNADLRAKLATLDDQVNQLKAKNAPVTEALPSDVDPALVVAPQTALLATESASHVWRWVFICVILVIMFFVACVVISRRRSRY